MKSRKNFSLIELLIVIVIIGILSYLIIPQLGLTEDSAKEAVSAYNMAGYGRTLRAYNTKYGCYPAGFHMADYSKKWGTNPNLGTDNYVYGGWTGEPKNLPESFAKAVDSGKIASIPAEDQEGCAKSLKLAGIKYVTTGDCEQCVMMDAADDNKGICTAFNNITGGAAANNLLWTLTPNYTQSIWGANGTYFTEGEREKPFGKFSSIKYIVPMSITCSVAWTNVYKQGVDYPSASTISAPAPWFKIDNHTTFNFPLACFVVDPNGKIPAELIFIVKPDGTILETF